MIKYLTRKKEKVFFWLGKWRMGLICDQICDLNVFFIVHLFFLKTLKFFNTFLLLNALFCFVFAVSSCGILNHELNIVHDLIDEMK